MSDFQQRLTWAAERLKALREAIGSVLVGQREVVDQVLIAMLAGGHVLLEGAPGLGKTLLVRTLASCLELSFSRIQFTPDLMPSDVIGTNVLIEQPGGGRTFALHRGPIFGQVVLADEINRATPKTQSALLEAMQESAVTIAGQRHALGQPFFVLATENPIEMEGTYPLPEAQLDRFLVKVLVPEPGEDDLVEVLSRTTGQDKKAPSAVVSVDDVLALRALCRDITVTEQVARFAARIVKASSPAHPSAPPLVRRAIRYGAGVRGAQSLILGGKAMSLMNGKAHVSFKDVAQMAKPAMRHRLIRSFEGEADGVTTDAVVDALLEAVPPRPDQVEAALAEARNR
jgi:MoxR-like ATPase